MSVLKAEIFTKTLSDSAIVIGIDDGVRSVSVLASSGDTGNVLGSKTVGGVESDPIILQAGDGYSLTAIEGSVISGLTITAPESVVLLVTMQL
jgi:hypothetical protein